jgi:hypothetical protein
MIHRCSFALLVIVALALGAAAAPAAAVEYRLQVVNVRDEALTSFLKPGEARDGDRYIVEVAESRYALAPGVMAGRAHERERGLARLGASRGGERAGQARAGDGVDPRIMRDVGVLEAAARDALDVAGAVDLEDRFVGGGMVRREQLMPGGPQTFRRAGDAEGGLGMPWGMVPGRGRVAEDCRHRCTF